MDHLSQDVTPTPICDALRQAGQFSAALEALATWDAPWTETFMALVHNVETSGVLDRKLVELIRLNIDATVTHLYAPGVQRHIQNALRLGVTRAEILEVLKLACVVGIHSSALAAPILTDALAQAGIPDAAAGQSPSAGATPMCDAARAAGQFNPLWETLYRWDPQWMERFVAMGFDLWRDPVLPPLWIELLCIAGDAAITHMYAPGTRRHIQAALQLGATREQILEVLKIVSVQGIEFCELAVPILEEELRQLDTNASTH